MSAHASFNEFEEKRAHMEKEYERFLARMHIMGVPNEKISSERDFLLCPKRHFEYVLYCKLLIKSDGLEFLQNGGGRTFNEFDRWRCIHIAKMAAGKGSE